MTVARLRVADAVVLVALAAASPAEADPLERHRPILRYDRDETDFASSVAVMTALTAAAALLALGAGLLAARRSYNRGR